MGESKVSTLTLEQSVSFGKFENDSLSWEKWSSFSPNKYLDEVEKCSTPGSVAEKKAYFEAHYKKIAAKKAELEQDNPVQGPPARSEELKDESYTDDTSRDVDEFDVCVAEKLNVEAEQIAQQKAYFEELYIKMADRMGEHVEQDTDTPMQYTYPILDELKHKNHTDNTSACDSELNTCSAEKTNVEVDQIAQKKAYFEAQVKKSSVWRSERLEQDKPLSSAYCNFDELQQKGRTESPHTSDCTFDACVGKNSTKQVEQEEVVVIKAKYPIVNEFWEKQEIGAAECLSTSIEEAKEDLMISQPVYTEKKEQEVVGIEVKGTIGNDGVEKLEISVEEHPSNSIEEAKEDLTISQCVYTGVSSDSGMESVIAEEPSCVVNPPDPVKLVKKVYNNAKTAPSKEVKRLEVKEQNITAKKVSSKKEQPLTGKKKTVLPSAAKSSLVSSSRSPKLATSTHLMTASEAQPVTTAKKKLVSSAAKSSTISTPRPSKLAPPSPLMSAPKLPSKKLNPTYLPRSKNTTPVGENKRAGQTSMHMSLNLGSSVEPASARKSLIMEKMADKDIIKRAFSSFKNNFQELRASHNEKSLKAFKELERKVTTPPQKDSEGLRKAADKTTPTRGQLGISSYVVSGRVVSHEDNKRGKAFSPSVDSKSEDGAEKRKDFLKKLGQKSITREMEKVQIPTKSKGKGGEMKLLKRTPKIQSLPVQKDKCPTIFAEGEFRGV